MQKMSEEELDNMVLYFLSRHVGEQNKIDRMSLFGSASPQFEELEELEVTA